MQTLWSLRLDKTSTKSGKSSTLKEKLIQAALLALRQGSLQSLSLRDLARKCRVSEAAPYRHFRDREALLAELARQGFADLRARIDRAVSGAPDAREEFLRMCGAYLELGVEDPHMLKMMFGPFVTPSPDHPELMHAAKLAYLTLTRVVQNCQRAGLLGPGDAIHKAMHTWMAIHGFTTLVVDFRCQWLGVNADNVHAAYRGYCEELLSGLDKPLDSRAIGFLPSAHGVTEDLLREAGLTGRVVVKLS